MFSLKCNYHLLITWLEGWGYDLGWEASREISKVNCSPPPTGRLMPSQSLKSSHHGKQNTSCLSTCSWHLLLPLRLFFFIADCGIAQYGISLWSLQVRCSSSALLSVFCPPPTYSLQWEQSQKKSSLDVEQALCIGSQNTSAAVATDPKAIWAARKGVNSILASRGRHLCCVLLQSSDRTSLQTERVLLSLYFC